MKLFIFLLGIYIISAANIDIVKRDIADNGLDKQEESDTLSESEEAYDDLSGYDDESEDNEERAIKKSRGTTLIPSKLHKNYNVFKFWSGGKKYIVKKPKTGTVVTTNITIIGGGSAGSSSGGGVVIGGSTGNTGSSTGNSVNTGSGVIPKKKKSKKNKKPVVIVNGSGTVSVSGSGTGTGTGTGAVSGTGTGAVSGTGTGAVSGTGTGAVSGTGSGKKKKKNKTKKPSSGTGTNSKPSSGTGTNSKPNSGTGTQLIGTVAIGQTCNPLTNPCKSGLTCFLGECVCSNADKKSSGLLHNWLFNGDYADSVECSEASEQPTNTKFVPYSDKITDKVASISDGFIPVSEGIYFGGDFTITVWVKVTEQVDDAILLDFGNGPSTDNVIISLSSGSTGFPALMVYKGGNKVGEVVATKAIPVGVWTYLEALNDDGNLALFVDNEKVGEATGESPESVTRSQNFIGKSSDPASPKAKCDVSDLKIFNVALTPDQQVSVQTGYIPSYTVPDTTCVDADKISTGLLYYYPLNGNLKDTVQCSTLTKSPAVQFVEDPDLEDKVTDLNNGFLTLPTEPYFDGDFSISAWVKPNSIVPNSVIADFGNGDNADNVIFGLSSDDSGKPFVEIYQGAEKLPAVTSDKALTPGEWSHVLVTLNGNTVNLYVDGEPAGSGEAKPPLNLPRTKCNIGKSSVPNVNPADSKIANFKIYNRPLSPEEAKKDIHGLLSGQCKDYYKLATGLAHYWPLTSDFVDTVQCVPLSGVNNPTISTEDPSAVITEGAYLSVPTGVYFAGDFSISAMVKVTTVKPFARVIDFGNGIGLDNVILSLSKADSGSPYVSVYSGSTGGNNLASETPLPLGEWVKIIATQEGTKQTLYVNKVKAAEGEGSVPQYVQRSKNYIGKSNWPTDGSGDFQLKELKFYNRPLTQAEVEDDEATNDQCEDYELMSTGLIHNWDFDGDLVDSVQCLPLRSNTATPNFVDDENSDDNSKYLTLTDNYLVAPAGVYFNGDYTISAWVKVGSVKNWARVIDFGNGPNSNNVILGASKTTSGNPFTTVYRGAIITEDIGGSQKLPLNEWVYLVATLQGETATLYLNGNSIASARSQIPLGIVRYNNYIGKSNWASDQQPEMSIKSLKIYNRALSPEEVKQNTKGFLPNQCGDYDKISTGLLHHWSFSENLLDSVQCVPATNAQNSNLETEAATGIGSVRINNGYLTVPQGVYFKGDYSISAWVKPYSVKSWGRVVDFGNGAYADNVVLGVSNANSGKPFVATYNGGYKEQDLTSSDLLKLNQWSHIVATQEGTKQKLYVNGVKVADAQAAIAQNIVRRFNYIGKSNWGGDALGDLSLRSLKIYNRALQEPEIQDDLGGYVPSRCSEYNLMSTGLMYHWPFEKDLVDTVQCARAQNTLNAVLESDADKSNSYVNIKKGYLTVPPGVYVSGDHTISAWVNVNSISPYSRIIDFGNGAARDNIILALSLASSGNPYYSIYRGWYTTGDKQGSSALPLSTWTHVAATLSGTVQTLYVNGVVVGTATGYVPNNVMRYNNYIGGSNWGSDGYGDFKLKNLKIYNRPLTPQEIVNDMGGALPTKCPDYDQIDNGLIYNWPLGNNTIDTVQCLPLTRRLNAEFATDAATGTPYIEIKNGYLTAPAGVYFTNDYSVSAWVKLNTVQLWSRIIDFGNGASWDNVILGLSKGNTGYPFTSAYNWGSLTQDLASSKLLTPGQWTHVATVLQGTKISLYFNGVSVASGESYVPANRVRKYNYVGKSNWGADANSDFGLRNLRIYNRALSPEELAQDMVGFVGQPTAAVAAACTPDSSKLATGLQYNWDFNNNLYDTVQCTPMRIYNNAAFATDAASGWNHINIPRGSYVYGPARTYFYEGDYTITAWVNPNSIPNWAPLCDFSNGAGWDNIYAGLSNLQSGYPYLQTYRGSSKTAGWNKATAPLTVGKWTHYAAILKGTTQYVYLNGAQVLSAPSYIPLAVVRNKAYIGYDSWGDQADVRIRNFRIYNRALTPEELKQDANGFVAAANPMAAPAGCDAPDAFRKSKGLMYNWDFNNNLVDTVQCAKLTATNLAAFQDDANMGGSVMNIKKGGYLTAPTGTYFDGGDYTVSAWVNPNSFPNWAPLCDFGNGIGSDNILVGLSNLQSGFPYLQTYNGGSKTSGWNKATKALVVGNWVHYTALLRGTTQYVYLNGSEVLSAPSMIPRSISRTKNYIGTDAWNELGDFLVKNFRIYNRALTPSEILEDMNGHVGSSNVAAAPVPQLKQTCTPDDAKLATGLQYNWDFDYSLYDTVQCTLLKQELNANFETDPYNGYRHVNIQNGYLSGPAGVYFKGDYSVSAWVNLNSVATWGRVLDFGNGAPFDNIVFGTSSFSTGFPFINTANAGATKGDLVSSKKLNIGEWAHICATQQGDQLKIYFNGELVGTQTAQIARDVKRNNIYVGRSNYAGDAYANARYRNVRIYNRALSPDEVLECMSGFVGTPVAPSAPTCNPVDAFRKWTGLMYNWDFNNNLVDTVQCVKLTSVNPTSFVNDAALGVSNINIQKGYLYGPEGFYFQGGDYAVTAWVKINSVPNWAALFDCANGAGNDNILIGLSNLMSSNPYMQTYNAYTKTSGWLTSSGKLAIGQWTHIAAMLKGTTQSIWINGAQTVSGDSAVPRGVLRKFFYIGRDTWGDQSDFNLRNFRIYNRFLTAEELQQDMVGFVKSAGAPTGPECTAVDAGKRNTGLQYNWNFDNSLYDTVQCSLLKVQNQAAFENDAASTRNVMNIKYGGYLYGAPATYFDAGDYSVTAWVNPTSIPNWAALFDCANGANNDNILIGLSNLQSGAPYMQTYNAGSKTAGWPASSKKLVNGEWAHVTALLKGTTQYIYINGEETMSAPSNVPRSVIRNYFYIGRDTWGDLSNFKIRQFRIYNRALTPEEIKQDMTTFVTTGAVAAPACTAPDSNLISTGLQYYWDFNRNLEDRVQCSKFTAKGQADYVSEGDVSVMNIPTGSYLTGQPAVYFYGDYTVTAWINVASFPNWAVLADFANGAGVDNVVLGISNLQSGAPWIQTYNGWSKTAGWNKASKPIVIGQWTHYAAKLEGTTQYLYLNGEQVLSVPSNVPKAVIRNKVYIGTDTWSDYGNFKIKSFKIFNRSLTAAEIMGDMNGNAVVGAAADTTCRAVDADKKATGLQYKWDFTQAANALVDTVQCVQAELKSTAQQITEGGVNLVNTNNGYLQLPAGTYFDAGDFTITAYIYVNSIKTWGGLCDFANGKNNDNILVGAQSYSNDKPYMQVYNGGSYLGNWLISTKAAPVGQWSHIAAQLSGTTMNLYVNGELGATAPGKVPNKVNRIYNYIGSDNWGDISNFKIKGFKIFNRALSVDEIKADIVSFGGTAPQGCVAVDADKKATGLQYKWDFTQATNALYDTVQCVQAELKSTAQQITEGGVNLVNTNNGYLQLPAGTYFDAGDFTITAYIYVNSIKTWGGLCDFANGKNNDNILVGAQSYSNDKPYMQVYNGGSYLGNWLISTKAAPVGQWSHIAAQLSGTTMNLYVNGELGATAPGKVPNKVNRIYNYIGSDNWGDISNFKIKGFKIFNRALSVDEIKADIVSFGGTG